MAYLKEKTILAWIKQYWLWRCCWKNLALVWAINVLHQKLRQLGYFVDEETVRLCLKILVPSVVELGICRRLQRRAYLSPGPDHTWHTDGYDKLKPYEFARHGAIDGYSRKILWLYVSASNNNSSNIAFYFLQTITELNRIPQVVRGDRSSENVTVCGVQRFLRRDFDDILSGQASFWFGSSTPNQWMEDWWSQFRRAKGTCWINFFKDLIDSSIYDNSITTMWKCRDFASCQLYIINWMKWKRYGTHIIYITLLLY